MQPEGKGGPNSPVARASKADPGLVRGRLNALLKTWDDTPDTPALDSVLLAPPITQEHLAKLRERQEKASEEPVVAAVA